MQPFVANWSCGEDEFLLRIGEIEALDDLTEKGALDFRWRLSEGVQRGSLAYSPVKLREVMACIRLGLIGAGMDRAKADRKVKQAVDDADISELNLLAFSILTRAFAGKEHDPVGEAEAGAATDESASPASTEPEPPSAGPRRKSKQ